MGHHEAHGGGAAGVVVTTGSAGATPDDLERGRLLFAEECAFVTAAGATGGLPVLGPPEVAFAGRSNVGKSSLVNALTGRNTLARTSRTPGRTRQINFFAFGERLLLVDLPGYGFARASKTDIAAWTGLVNHYLEGRPHLRRVCLLIDARRGILAPDRAAMARLGRAAVAYQIVLTKADAVPGADLAALGTAVSAEIARDAAAHPEIIATSARAGTGMPVLRAELARLALPR